MNKQHFLLLTMICLTGLCSEAQYKKASFLNKTGRIYELGLTMKVQNAEHGSAPGVFFSYGREKEEQRLHYWLDAEMVAPNTYSYNSTDVFSTSVVPVKVTGKNGGSFAFRFSLGYFLTENKVSKNKLIPFTYLTLAWAGPVNVSQQHAYTSSPTGTAPRKMPVFLTSDLLACPGAGILYRMNERTALRLSSTYNLLLTQSKFGGSGYFRTTENHPAFNLALRVRMKREK